IDIESEFSTHSNQVVDPESLRPAGEVYFSNRLRSSATTKETLTHRILRNDDIVITFGSKGNIITRQGDLLSFQLKHFLRKLRIEYILPQRFIELWLKLRLREYVPHIARLPQCSHKGEEEATGQKQPSHNFVFYC